MSLASSRVSALEDGEADGLTLGVVDGLPLGEVDGLAKDGLAETDGLELGDELTLGDLVKPQPHASSNTGVSLIRTHTAGGRAPLIPS